MSVIKLPPPLELVRAHPAMYIPTGNYPLWYRLQTALIFDALTLGANAVTARRHGKWNIVESNTDWLRLGRYTPSIPAELFSRVFPFVEAGDNNVRHEIVVAAFSSSVAISGPEGLTIIQRSDSVTDQEVIGVFEGTTSTRAVAFADVSCDQELTK